MQTQKRKEKKTSPKQIGKNLTAQRIIKAMEKPPYVSKEDIESLLQVIKEAKQPTQFESPFETIFKNQVKKCGINWESSRLVSRYMRVDPMFNW